MWTYVQVARFDQSNPVSSFSANFCTTMIHPLLPPPFPTPPNHFPSTIPPLTHFLFLYSSLILPFFPLFSPLFSSQMDFSEACKYSGALSFSPCGRLLATASDHRVVLRCARSLRVLQVMTCPDRVSALAFSPLARGQRYLPLIIFLFF